VQLLPVTRLRVGPSDVRRVELACWVTARASPSPRTKGSASDHVARVLVRDRGEWKGAANRRVAKASARTLARILSRLRGTAHELSRRRLHGARQTWHPDARHQRPPAATPGRIVRPLHTARPPAHGAYVLRDHDKSRPKQGTVLVLGTSTTESVVELLPRFADAKAPNVKIVAALSPELIRRQSEAYRNSVLSHDDWLDSTSITNGAKKLMHDWTLHHVAEEYAMISDFDDRWRTGGNVAELKKEAHIDPDSLWAGITKFANERTKRLKSLVHPDAR
jgi:hypothetical protein